MLHYLLESYKSLTFDRDAGRYGRLPPPVTTPGNTDLVVDVVSGLTEEMDVALLGETSTWGWIAAETSMFWHQRVSAVAQSACRNTKRCDESKSLKCDILLLPLCTGNQDY